MRLPHAPSPAARRAASATAVVAAVAALVGAGATGTAVAAPGATSSTPIQHLVVIYDENVSFDHYFGTYPTAANSDGVPFTAAAGTPTDAATFTNAGLAAPKNPNSTQPFRLTPAQALTCDQNHSYGAEQKAVDGNANDKYPEFTSKDTCGTTFGRTGLVMGYYDGNTVPALWNYAQNYAMSDNTSGSTFGPSTPGALNLIAGQTWGAKSYLPTQTEPGKVVQTPTPDPYAVLSPNANGTGTVINDPDPVYDDCSDADHTSKNNLAALQGKNIGDLLNERNVTWGWFQGGFAPSTAWDGKQGDYAKCAGTTHTTVAQTTAGQGVTSEDYSPHHSPFEYYASTSNPHHLPPSSVAAVGSTDQANHNYDLSEFDAAVTAGNLPAVSFLKAPEYEDGHAAYSDPIDEQNFLIKEINLLQKSKDWASTAVVVTYDDTDGWYDHQALTITNGSQDPVNDSALCTSAAASQGVAGGWQDRCGPGPRIPLVAVSPYARNNAIDHTPLEQASVLRFIEDNWQTGRVPAPVDTASAGAAPAAAAAGGSFDARAASIATLFDFSAPKAPTVILNPDGSVASVAAAPGPAPVEPVGQTPGLPGAPQASNGSAPLAATGRNVTLPLGVGVLAVALGTGLYVAARRRRTA